MLDFRLRVFYTVAKLLNFTKAAAQLHVTQPAVTKHIKELELHYKTTLFDRQPNALALTEAGQILYRHANIIMEQYELLDFDLQAMQNTLGGILKIGASTTIAQYVLPPVLAAFHKRYPDIDLHMINENSTHVLHALMEKEIEVAFVEGKTDNNNIHFERYLKDEIVLVTNTKNKIINKGSIKLLEVQHLPLILREGDSGTYAILIEHLAKAGVQIKKLNVKMHLGGTESIKLFLENSDYFAFISIHGIINELTRNSLSVIDIEGLEISRYFHIATRQGHPTPLAGQLLKFIGIYSR